MPVNRGGEPTETLKLEHSFSEFSHKKLNLSMIENQCPASHREIAAVTSNMPATVRRCIQRLAGSIHKLFLMTGALTFYSCATPSTGIAPESYSSFKALGQTAGIATII
jgi:hypothetical protein